MKTENVIQFLGFEKNKIIFTINNSNLPPANVQTYLILFDEGVMSQKTAQFDMSVQVGLLIGWSDPVQN